MYNLDFEKGEIVKAVSAQRQIVQSDSARIVGPWGRRDGILNYICAFLVNLRSITSIKNFSFLLSFLPFHTQPPRRHKMRLKRDTHSANHATNARPVPPTPSITHPLLLSRHSFPTCPAYGEIVNPDPAYVAEGLGCR